MNTTKERKGTKSKKSLHVPIKTRTPTYHLCIFFVCNFKLPVCLTDTLILHYPTFCEFPYFLSKQILSVRKTFLDQKRRGIS